MGRGTIGGGTKVELRVYGIRCWEDEKKETCRVATALKLISKRLSAAATSGRCWGSMRCVCERFGRLSSPLRLHGASEFFFLCTAWHSESRGRGRGSD